MRSHETRSCREGGVGGDVWDRYGTYVSTGPGPGHSTEGTHARSLDTWHVHVVPALGPFGVGWYDVSMASAFFSSVALLAHVRHVASFGAAPADSQHLEQALACIPAILMSMPVMGADQSNPCGRG